MRVAQRVEELRGAVGARAYDGVGHALRGCPLVARHDEAVAVAPALGRGHEVPADAMITPAIAGPVMRAELFTALLSAIAFASRLRPTISSTNA